MCLRNIDQRGGLCNGTRLQIVRMGVTNIEEKIISSSKVVTVVAIPRMNISTSDKKMPFQLNRRQYPIAVCFAMKINKSQAQTLSKSWSILGTTDFFTRTTLCSGIKSKEQEGSKAVFPSARGENRCSRNEQLPLGGKPISYGCYIDFNIRGDSDSKIEEEDSAEEDDAAERSLETKESWGDHKSGTEFKINGILAIRGY
ncbi:hypothetical protein Tco_0610849 [Tanacetum coccineum]